MNGGGGAAGSPVEVIRSILEWWSSVPYPTLRSIFLAADGFDDAIARVTRAGFDSSERWFAPDIEVGVFLEREEALTAAGLSG